MVPNYDADPKGGAMTEFQPLDGSELVLGLIEAGELAKARIFADGLRRRAPGHPVAHFLDGSLALKEGRLAEAILALATALGADPENTVFRDVLERARITYAKRLAREGRAEEARAELDAANAARPDGVFAVLRAATWLDPIPASRAAMNQGRRAYNDGVRALSKLDLPTDPERVMDSGPHFFAPYQGVDTRSSQEIIADFYRRTCPSLSYRAKHVDGAAEQTPDRRLRIGFVSAYFSNHTIGKLYRGIIRHLDRRQYHVTVFFIRAQDDDYARAIARESDRSVMLPNTLPEARETIVAERLDILFYPEIGMDPLTYFLAFARLARLQVMSWGHPMTSGLSSIDVFVSSIDLEVPGSVAATHYTERLRRLSLPPTYFYPPQRASAADAPDLSFARGRTIYCCPQSLFKIHPDYDDILLAILRRDPNGMLVLIEAEPGWADRLRERWRLAERGLSDRVVFLPRQSQPAFLGLLASVPVVLDTTYFSGGVSTIEALAQGTPVVTWPNTPLMCGRVSTAYYRAMGVMDCVADSAEDYVARALRLATDPDHRSTVSARICANVHKLFRRAEVLAELEILLREEWRARRDSNSQPSDP
jgi:protein O-GlcNAc transferase